MQGAVDSTSLAPITTAAAAAAETGALAGEAVLAGVLRVGRVCWPITLILKP